MSEQVTINNSSLSVILATDMKDLDQQLQAISNFQHLVKNTLTVDQDYGIIPGTNKPTLLKPGAEKIIMIMGLTSRYEVTEKVENYEEGFFSYTVKSQLFKNGQLITEGFGLANTRETRYKLKEGKGWQDPYTIANTVLKMAKKRAQVDASLTVGSLSNVFTQDLEDLKEADRKEELETMTLVEAQAIKLDRGKHQGKTLADVEKGYLKWLSEKFDDPRIKQACQLILAEQSQPQKIEEPAQISDEQLAEIERLVEIIATVHSVSVSEVLEKYEATDYRQFNSDIAQAFIQGLEKNIADLPYPEPKV